MMARNRQPRRTIIDLLHQAFKRINRGVGMTFNLFGVICIKKTVS